eukprot:scaffold5114_cov67-Cylindrotheca_fusiformis.AAC.17
MRNPNRTTAVATRQFFEWLETNYGGLPLLRESSHKEDAAPKVLKRSHLCADDLKDLFSHKIVGLHISSFYPRTSAKELGRKLAKEAEDGGRQNWKVSTARGLESSDVFTMGAHVPWNMAVAQSETDAYLANVRKEFRGHRIANDTAKPIWPMDQLRLELDEVWPCGANLSRQGGKPMGGGLPRVMMGPTRWKKGLIHVDELGPLHEDKGCFSANIYLKLPEEEQPVLDIWPLDIRSRWDWYRNAHSLSELTSQSAEGQVKLRSLLGDPERIHVEPGDLVMLCVQRPHAAVGFQTQATRVSLQTFLQYEGEQNPLKIEA